MFINKKEIKYDLKLLAKLIFLFIVGGIIYCCIEIVYRGYTHWTMFFLGGLCFITCGALNEIWSWDVPLLKQMLIADLLVTSYELVSGIILNIILKLNVWDYTNMPFNFLGQICLPYMIIWFFLCGIAIVLDDYIRYWVFGEEHPRYKLL